MEPAPWHFVEVLKTIVVCRGNPSSLTNRTSLSSHCLPCTTPARLDPTRLVRQPNAIRSIVLLPLPLSLSSNHGGLTTPGDHRQCFLIRRGGFQPAARTRRPLQLTDLGRRCLRRIPPLFWRITTPRLKRYAPIARALHIMTEAPAMRRTRR